MQSKIEIDMEKEELNICKTMFVKNLRLILDGHVRIDLDQFSVMEKEYRQLLREHIEESLL